MADRHDWLEVTLDANNRRGLADSIEHNLGPGNEESGRLVRVLRSNRDELLLDKNQGEIVLSALNVDGQLSALRARLEAFLGRR